MKRINRREFAKLAGSAVLVVPLAPLAANARGEPGMAWPQEPPKKPDTPAMPAPAQQPETPRFKLSKEQEEAVKKAVERRERQLAAIRGRTLAYDAEPAFVFQVRRRPRSGPKM